MTSAAVELAGVTRDVKLWFMRFPTTGGAWAFFICPTCSRRCLTLRLFDGRFVCSSCDGLLLHCQLGTKPGAKSRGSGEGGGDKGPRIQRLRALLAGKPAKRNRLELALRRALIAQRRERLLGWKSSSRRPSAP